MNIETLGNAKVFVDELTSKLVKEFQEILDMCWIKKMTVAEANDEAFRQTEYLRKFIEKSAYYQIYLEYKLYK